MTRLLTRRVRFDERSRAHGVRELVAGKQPRSYTWSCSTWLDQGQEGACTGFATAHDIAARPINRSVGMNYTQATRIYHRARQLDEWPGEDYEGSSVLGAVQAAKEFGYFGSYKWAFGVDDLVMAIGYVGPAILGINWYDGMSEPDDKGVIRVSGALSGGHAILCNGYSTKTRMFRLHNSWGPDWGSHGDCFISFDDMVRLLKEQGEACVPRK